MIFFLITFLISLTKSQDIIHEGTILISQSVEVRLDNETLGVSECSELDETQYYSWKAIQFNSPRETQLLLSTNATNLTQVKYYLKVSSENKCNQINITDKPIFISRIHQYRLIIVSDDPIMIYFSYNYQTYDPVPTITNVPFYRYTSVPHEIPERKNICEDDEKIYGYTYYIQLPETKDILIHTCNYTDAETIISIINKANNTNRCITSENAFSQEDKTCSNGKGTLVSFRCEKDVSYEIHVGFAKKQHETKTFLLTVVEGTIEEEEDESEEEEMNVLLICTLIGIALGIVLILGIFSIIMVVREKGKHKDGSIQQKRHHEKDDAEKNKLLEKNDEENNIEEI